MSIGKGWFPVEPKSELELIAEKLLRESLHKIFDKQSERNIERLKMDDEKS